MQSHGAKHKYRTKMVIEDLQRRQDELQKRIELVRSYL